MKAQITVFMLIVVVLLVLFAGVFAARSFIARDVNPEVVNYVTDCLRITAEDGVVLLSKNGGYIEPVNPVSFEISSAPVPTEEGLEANLKQYIDEKIHGCLNFADLPSRPVPEGEPRSEVKLGKGVTVKLNLPLLANERRLETFQTSINFDLRSLRDIAESVQAQGLEIDPETFEGKETHISEADDYLIITVLEPYKGGFLMFRWAQR